MLWSLESLGFAILYSEKVMEFNCKDYVIINFPYIYVYNEIGLIINKEYHYIIRPLNSTKPNIVLRKKDKNKMKKLGPVLNYILNEKRI